MVTGVVQTILMNVMCVAGLMMIQSQPAVAKRANNYSVFNAPCYIIAANRTTFLFVGAAMMLSNNEKLTIAI